MARRRPTRKISRKQHLWLIFFLVVLLVVLVLLFRSGRFRGAGSTRSVSRREKVEKQRDLSAASPSSFPKPAPTAPSPSNSVSVKPTSPGGGLELPRCTNATFIRVNQQGHYTLLYDTTYRQAAWVCYLLTRSEVQTNVAERATQFQSDPEVIRRGWPTARDRDYSHSGYDRGHLLPSADRNATSEENKATFLLSNISPQRPALNRQTWKALEEQVRRWAQQYDSLYVVTGPELKPGLPRISGGVGVPERYFKAVLVRHKEGYQAIAFLIPNFDEPQGTFRDYVLTVDELEATVGYDLFYNLPAPQQARAESLLDRTFWK